MSAMSGVKYPSRERNPSRRASLWKGCRQGWERLGKAKVFPAASPGEMEPSATPTEGYGRLRKHICDGVTVWRARRVGGIPIVLNALFLPALTSLTTLQTLVQIDFPTVKNRRIVRGRKTPKPLKTLICLRCQRCQGKNTPPGENRRGIVGQ